MRKLLAATALLCALVAIQAVPVQAAVTTNTTIPSAFTFFDACTNEPVADGFVKGVISVTADPETSERWRAELAAGKLPQDSEDEP
jgi:Na+-translocating ferredoxin:NAD+ oxidoreductase RNF subunit RnfB